MKSKYYPIRAESIFEVAKLVLTSVMVCFSNKWKGPKGGCFCLMEKETGIIFFTSFFGNSPKEKMKKRFELAQEKANRLFQHPEHKTSWESRDPNNDKWGGAVSGKKYIYSFSGFPENMDTVAMAKLAELVERVPANKLVSKVNPTVLDILETLSARA